jgi:hypothetical protein
VTLREAALREELELHLYKRWPAIFSGRHGPDSLMVWGCAHGDGWYAILNALCEVLTARAAVLGRLPPTAVQVKEKWAGLRFYTSGLSDDFDRGALAMGEALSYRICEVTGHPGRVSSRAGLVYSTLAPHVAARRGFAPTEGDARRPLPPVADAAHLLATRWPEIISGTVALPVGWYDLADVLLECVAKDSSGNASRVRVRTLRRVANRLVVRMADADARADGMAAFAAAMSTRVDIDTGAARVPQP